MNCKYCNRKLSFYKAIDQSLTLTCNHCQAAFYYKLLNNKMILNIICLQTYLNNKLYKIFMYDDLTNIFHYIEPEISSAANLILRFNLNLNLIPTNVNHKLKTILVFS